MSCISSHTIFIKAHRRGPVRALPNHLGIDAVPSGPGAGRLSQLIPCGELCKPYKLLLLKSNPWEILLKNVNGDPCFPFDKAGVDICTVPAAYLHPQPPTAPQERNFTLFLKAR